MKVRTKAAVLAVALISAGTTMSSEASAAGWIAHHILKPICGEGCARDADKLHEKLGKPLDKVRDAAISSLMADKMKVF